MQRFLRLPVIPAFCVLLVLACSSAAPVDPGLAAAPLPPPPERMPLPAEPQPRQTRESNAGWQIAPAAGYEDGFGYVKLEFTPPEKLRETLAGRPGPGAVPAGGRLTLRLGRLNIAHANTIWYQIGVDEGSRSLLRFKGEDGIPNVRGPDGNWWNDLELDLPAKISGEVRVVLEDRKIGSSYTFTLTRLVTKQDQQ